MSKLAAMVELSKKMQVGGVVPYRSMQAKVEAFSDEHVFLSVPEIAINPEDIENLADGVRIRDREVENLKREVSSLRNEVERLIRDPYYRNERASRDKYDQEMNRRMWADASRMLYRGWDYGKEEKIDPKPTPYYDPLSFKRPSQQK